jgi:hypothetical protein
MVYYKKGTYLDSLGSGLVLCIQDTLLPIITPQPARRQGRGRLTRARQGQWGSRRKS